MTQIRSLFVDLASHLLAHDERDAVLGDLAESGETAGQVIRSLLGLIVRKQAELLRDWRPWLVLVSLGIPFGWPIVWPIGYLIVRSIARRWRNRLQPV